MAHSSRRPVAGVGWIMVSIAFTVLARPLDGLVRGLLTGAGVASIIVGAVILNQWRRRGGWLPSRDGDARR